MEEDPFDALLKLEDKYYSDGHALGRDDGAIAGRLEGRLFGLEKGFEKFYEMGKLHGRSVVWSSRLSITHASPEGERSLETGVTSTQTIEQTQAHASEGTSSVLQPVVRTSRMEKHLRTFHALVEPASLPQNNAEGAVSEFDDRYKRAQAKAKVIEKLLGESNDTDETNRGQDVGL
ncbi:hypothetical protein MMC25_007127 [Agyrium rufum]|nr:hypothetical protein [Agyrium rufum]